MKSVVNDGRIVEVTGSLNVRSIPAATRYNFKTALNRYRVAVAWVHCTAHLCCTGYSIAP